MYTFFLNIQNWLLVCHSSSDWCVTMFFTSVAYDYYKGFVTGFIEINGQPETIFGKPPLKYILPLVSLQENFNP